MLKDTEYNLNIIHSSNTQNNNEYSLEECAIHKRKVSLHKFKMDIVGLHDVNTDLETQQEVQQNFG